MVVIKLIKRSGICLNFNYAKKMNLFLVISANLLRVVLCSLPCDLNYGVNISDGLIYQNGDIGKDGILYKKEDYVKKDNVTIGCICNIKSCLRKCCPVGEFLTNKTCQPSDVEFAIPENLGPQVDNFYIIHGNDCPPNRKRSLLYPNLPGRLGEFKVEENGMLFLPPTEEYYSQTHYCVDFIDDYDDVKALMCSNDKARISTSNIVGMIISMPFLLSTFLVYIILPERNLYGKCLICYVLSLFCAYLILVYIQLHHGEYFNDSICIFLGIVCYFFFIVSFFFMNVMSIDIWWTFRAFRGFTKNKKRAEQKRFIYYSIYAWGVPFLMVLLITSLTVTLEEDSEEWYNPGLASGQCWLGLRLPTMIYFYTPVAIIIAANILLFGITAWKIKQIQRDTAVLRNEDNRKHNYESDKRRFNLYLKLMMAMGINWSCELISAVVDWQVGGIPRPVWYISDLFNALYGVFIFLIFVFKKSIWIKLKNRYFSLMGKPKISGSTTVVDNPPPLQASHDKNHQEYPVKEISLSTI